MAGQIVPVDAVVAQGLLNPWGIGNFPAAPVTKTKPRALSAASKLIYRPLASAGMLAVLRRTNVCSYCMAMSTVHDVESIRRSASMAPLSSDEAFRVLEACDQLLRERARIAEVLADLPASWANVRKVLNELQAIVSHGGLRP